jgi:hypothetical protein
MDHEGPPQHSENLHMNASSLFQYLSVSVQYLLQTAIGSKNEHNMYIEHTWYLDVNYLHEC